MRPATMISTQLNASCHPVLTWKEVDGAQGYRIYRRMPGETWKILKTLGNSVLSYTCLLYTSNILSWIVENLKHR